MADEEILSWRFKNWKIVNIFNYYGSIRRDITKWTLWLDSYHQINLTKKFNRFLMTLGRCFSCKDMNYDDAGGVFQFGLIFDTFRKFLPSRVKFAKEIKIKN